MVDKKYWAILCCEVQLGSFRLKQSAMGRVIRGCRKGKGSVFKAHTTGRQGAVSMKKQDFAERHGYVKGVVKAIVHDSGRGAPVAQIQFKDTYRFKKINTLLCAPEGLYSGQFIFAGRKGTKILSVHFLCFTLVSLQPALPLETSFLLARFLRELLSATLRPKWVTVASWPEHLVIMLSLFRKMRRREFPESDCLPDQRKLSPIPVEL